MGVSDAADKHHLDPFSPPNAGQPRIYIERLAIGARFQGLVSRLGAGRWTPGIAMHGCRGSGKSIELQRLGMQLLEVGVLPVPVELSGRESLETQVVRGFANVLKEPDRAARRSYRWTASAKIPFTPIELGVESSPGSRTPRLEDVLRSVREIPAYRDTGVVFLVDEADLMMVAEFEECFSNVLGRAARIDSPVTVVAAGSGLAFRRSMQGVRSFQSDLVRPAHLSRIDDVEATELLVVTAGLAGDEWDAEALLPLVEACRGIPRLLQMAGSDVFCGEGRLGVRVANATAELTRTRKYMISMQTEPEERRVLRTIVDSSMAPAAIETLEDILPDEDRRRFYSILERLLIVGSIEIDDDFVLHLT